MGVRWDMFGYRIIHRDVLAHLLSCASQAPAFSEPAWTASGTLGATVRVAPQPATAAPVVDALPPEVVQSVAGWESWEHARLTGLARDLLDSGMSAGQVAHVIAAGEPVTD